ncbi:MAG TPA: hypothetical protein VNZ64_12360 [Candidatus Acidoferrum sp.]|nr:hypothetical protein [Candidatus Acidoferrum sp.]
MRKKKSQKAEAATAAAKPIATTATEASSDLESGLQAKPKERTWEHLKAYQWKRGESGNKSGKRKGDASITAGLRRALSKRGQVEKIVAAMIDAVISKKDSQMSKLILERVDGSLREILDMKFHGSIINPAPSGCVIILPDNHRGDSVPPELLPPVDVDLVPAQEPPVTTPAEAQPEKPQPVVESKPEAATPAPKLDPRLNPSSPHYIPACHRNFSNMAGPPPPDDPAPRAPEQERPFGGAVGIGWPGTSTM